MSATIEGLIQALLSARQRGVFRSKAIFVPYAPVSLEGVERLEHKVGVTVPRLLRDWLLAIGYGDLDEELSFREEWFAPIETGQLKGGARFAQDAVGNFYAFDSSGCIYFLSRSEPGFAVIADDFLEFLTELVHREYKLGDWIEGLDLQRYDW